MQLTKKPVTKKLPKKIIKKAKGKSAQFYANKAAVALATKGK